MSSGKYKDNYDRQGNSGNVASQSGISNFRSVPIWATIARRKCRQYCAGGRTGPRRRGPAPAPGPASLPCNLRPGFPCAPSWAKNGPKPESERQNWLSVSDNLKASSNGYIHRVRRGRTIELQSPDLCYFNVDLIRVGPASMIWKTRPFAACNSQRYMATVNRSQPPPPRICHRTVNSNRETKPIMMPTFTPCTLSYLYLGRATLNPGLYLHSRTLVSDIREGSSVASRCQAGRMVI